MRYVALLSGGKDSCFNLLHCARNGHDLVAAASLGPGHGKEELDSYMYQTVGQDAIELVARALDVPLYRRMITGDAVVKGAEYGGRNASDAGGVEGDETEDLWELLMTVKSHHPDVQGVSVGAILSNYQRVRVEHVCRRLGFTSLCYLWQRDQKELLSEMIDAGLQAVLIKVAGLGLTAQHLGKSLHEMQSILIKLNDLYGSHVCGEGGEYETLTLDFPLFKQRIVLHQVEPVVHSDNSLATVAYLRVKDAALHDKVESDFTLSVPPLLEAPYLAMRDVVLLSQETYKLPSVIHDEAGTPRSLSLEQEPEQSTHCRRIGSWVSVTNIQIRTPHTPDLSIESEVIECFNILSTQLAQHYLQLSNCTNINVFLSSIDLFARINAVYATFFGTSPPARACVAVDLPHPTRVRLDAVAFKSTPHRDRQALHVQGLSYWAPANIGPYSQAIIADNHIFVSGQIGLIPSCLSLPSPPSLALEAALASQHASRVVNALKDSAGRAWHGHAHGVLFWLSHQADTVHVKRAHITSSTRTPVLFVVVKSLPKGALVEKQALYHTGQYVITDEDDGEPISSQESPSTIQHSSLGPDSPIQWKCEISRFQNTSAVFALLSVKCSASCTVEDMKGIKENLSMSFAHVLSVRLFYVPSRAFGITGVLDTIFGTGKPPTTPIPCRHISTVEDDWDFSLCMIAF